MDNNKSDTSSESSFFVMDDDDVSVDAVDTDTEMEVVDSVEETNPWVLTPLKFCFFLLLYSQTHQMFKLH